tara:strand:+ start:401 stop:1039 length:639 start_codon:yes stop_codon:yes gene_type:complete
MKKEPQYDLKKHYFILTEVGLICSLLFLIAATNIEIKSDLQSNIFDQISIEPDKLLEIPITKEPEKIAPHKPMIFTPKPNDLVLEVDIPDFPEFGDFTNKIILPLKPEENPEKPVTYLPVMPTIIGGQKALYSKIKYSEIAQKLEIDGRVDVEFVIDKQGNVTNPKIVRSVHPELDKEVLRVIQLVRFSPGVQNGILVKVRMVQPIYFKLKR